MQKIFAFLSVLSFISVTHASTCEQEIDEALAQTKQGKFSNPNGLAKQTEIWAEAKKAFESVQSQMSLAGSDGSNEKTSNAQTLEETAKYSNKISHLESSYRTLVESRRALETQQSYLTGVDVTGKNFSKAAQSALSLELQKLESLQKQNRIAAFEYELEHLALQQEIEKSLLGFNCEEGTLNLKCRIYVKPVVKAALERLAGPLSCYRIIKHSFQSAKVPKAKLVSLFPTSADNSQIDQIIRENQRKAFDFEIKNPEIRRFLSMARLLETSSSPALLEIEVQKLETSLMKKFPQYFRAKEEVTLGRRKQWTQICALTTEDGRIQSAYIQGLNGEVKTMLDCADRASHAKAAAVPGAKASDVMPKQ